MKDPRIEGSATPRRRGIILIALGVVATGLSIGGIGAVLARGSSAPQTRPDTVSPVTPSPVASPAVPDLSPSVAPTEPSPSAEPALDPNALADGVYPTFLRAVDVQGATVTVDVLQIFVGGAARQAAIEDGRSWADVRYDPVYVRNENPLLRTLPVTRDVRIEFLDGCVGSNQWGGLTRLSTDAKPFTESLYYEVTVVGGSITEILQKIAISAC
jgi:hypothetical protein